MPLPAMLDLASVAPFALAAGGVMALFVVALMGCYNKVRLAREITARQRNEAALMARLDLYEAFFTLNQQCLMVWQPSTAQIWTSGQPPQGLTIIQDQKQLLDFADGWPPETVQELTQAIAALEQEGKNFDLYPDVGEGGVLHAKGWRVGTHMMVHFATISSRMQEYLQQKHRSDDKQVRLATLQMLLDEIKHPVWMRDHHATISWGNRAYFRVSGDDYELLPSGTREKINATLARNESYSDKIPIIIDGDRRIFDVTVVQGVSGSAGIGVDHTQMAMLEKVTRQTIADYRMIFDELPTAVAIFDASQKLEFFNQSFAQFWPLEVTFLESRPSHSHVLDRLRENRILAENPDWRQWQEQLFDASRTLEPQLHIWNLPDGRTLRVVANPGPQGGVTWLYEDLSEKLQLEARYNTLIHMQGETLDHLYEGVALFGPDGRLRLANPAFTRIWNLPPDLATQGVHISRIEDFCAKFCMGKDWQMIAAQVTGFTDARDMGGDRIDRLDDRMIDYKLVPLPQGQTMLSFVDVSDRARVARALAERNDALESASRLRTDFVSHVSYELRTPLTNIIGFTDLLRQSDFGTLNDRQHEYLNDIAAQSIELLHLVNDILDLATVDAGIMHLDIGKVEIAATMHAAISRIEKRMEARHITLNMQIDEGLTHFSADAARIRQVLFNLLANAVNFAPESSIIDFSACRQAEQVIFCVRDMGEGIPADILNQVFDRFYAQTHHGRRSGAGLGLAIVKSFVELHQGSVEIATGENKGTTITCYFPLEQPPQSALAHAVVE